MNTAIDLHGLNQLLAENTRLKAENDRLRDSISRLCVDWSDEYTHLQALCLGAGYPEQEVNESDPMISIKDLENFADLLEKKIPQ
jgi:hypothetical protein